MIEDVIAEIEGAREEARIECRILRDLSDSSHEHTLAHSHIARALSSLEGALYDANKAKEVLSK